MTLWQATQILKYIIIKYNVRSPTSPW